MTPHIDERNPQQNSRRQSVQRADSKNRAAVIPVEAVDDAETDRHTDGRDDGVGECHEEFCGEGFGGTEGGDPGAECEAFEHLVEDYYDEEGGVAGVAGDDEG